jgi:polynucleotide 5'-kinase involved in rRNA processing
VWKREQYAIVARQEEHHSQLGRAVWHHGCKAQLPEPSNESIDHRARDRIRAYRRYLMFSQLRPVQPTASRRQDRHTGRYCGAETANGLTRRSNGFGMHDV